MHEATTHTLAHNFQQKLGTMDERAIERRTLHLEACSFMLEKLVDCFQILRFCTTNNAEDFGKHWIPIFFTVIQSLLQSLAQNLINVVLKQTI